MKNTDCFQTLITEVSILNHFDDDFNVGEYVAEQEYLETFENTQGQADKPESDPYIQAKNIRTRNNLIREEIDKPHTCKKKCICVRIRMHLDLADKHLTNLLSILGGKTQ